MLHFSTTFILFFTLNSVFLVCEICDLDRYLCFIDIDPRLRQSVAAHANRNDVLQQTGELRSGHEAWQTERGKGSDG